MKHLDLEDLVDHKNLNTQDATWLTFCGSVVTETHIQAAYKLNPHIQRLEICCLQDISTGLWSTLEKFLDSLTAVHTLELERIHWTAPMANSLATHLKQCPIQKLMITICRFEQESDPMGTLLSSFKSLEVLSFFQNTLDQDHGISIEKVSKAISQTTHLKELRIDNLFIKDQDMNILLRACAKLPLKSFDFTWDHDKLQKHHIDLLYSLHTLESLHLSYAITKQLKDGTFSLCSNKDRDIMLADNTVESILQLLEKNPHLKNFEIQGGIGGWLNFANPELEILDRIMSKPMQRKLLNYLKKHKIKIAE